VGVGREDSLGSLQRQHPIALGKLTVEAAHHANWYFTTPWVAGANIKAFPWRQGGFVVESARMKRRMAPRDSTMSVNA
jgi:hypothetical protein